jgi:hypothetical protein
MIVSAYCMVFLCIFGFGQFFRVVDRESIFVYISISSIISLYIAWFLFLVSYASPFGEALSVLSILLAVAGFSCFFID